MGHLARQFWLYEWIDEHEIYSHDALSAALNSGTVMARLHELAVEAAGDKTTLQRDSTWSDSCMVAGQGFNLSGDTTCDGLKCLINEIDSGIARGWHYFDQVVVAGPPPGRLARQLERAPKKAIHRLHKDIHNYVGALLYLRDCGAEPRIIFRPNNWLLSPDELQSHAIEMGLPVAMDRELREGIIGQLWREGKHSTKFIGGEWHTRFRHPLIIEPMNTISNRRFTKREFVHRVFDRHTRVTIGDYVKARALLLPLASNVRAAWLRRPGQSNESALSERVGRVALKLELPVVNGLSTKDLLLLLEDQRPHFIRFQAALRGAITECLDKFDSKSDDEIAKAVMRDYIEPELQDINRRLSNANKTFTKKLGAGVAIGALTTSVGLIATMPLIIATGVAAGATLVPQVYKYLEDKATVETSDIYFLWNLQNRNHQ